jgi:hypothetical protein
MSQVTTAFRIMRAQFRAGDLAARIGAAVPSAGLMQLRSVEPGEPDFLAVDAQGVAVDGPGRPGHDAVRALLLKQRRNPGEGKEHEKRAETVTSRHRSTSPPA